MKLHSVALAACGLLAGVALGEDNEWIGTSGKWSDGANWSLGAPPTATQRALFPSRADDITIEVDEDASIETFSVEKGNGTGDAKLTLTGSHTITTCSTSASQYSPQIREKRCLVLDGASITLSNEKNVQVYGGLVLKSGSVFTINRHGQMFGDGAYITVDGGEYHNVGQQSYYPNSRITVNSGTFYQNNANGIFPNVEDSACNLTFVVNGGTATTKGIRLVNGSSLAVNGGTMSVTASKVSIGGNADTVTHSIVVDANSTLAAGGGKLTVNKEPEVADGATLALTGGELLMDGVVLRGRRWIDASTGTMIGALQLFPFTENDEMIVARCPLKATDYLQVDMTNVSLICTETSFIKQIRNGFGKNPTYSFPRLVMGGANWANTQDGNNRDMIVEGPLEIRAAANMAQQSGKNVYPRITGDVTVDTRDWNDPSVQRTIYLDGFGTYGGATLTVRGGGTCVVKQSYSQASFSRVSVEQGTTLTLMKKSMAGDSGYLKTTEFAMGANAVLSIPACGSNGVYAAKWSIDPTARIRVTIESGFNSGVLPILVDMGGVGVPAGILGQVEVTGLPEGATVGVFGKSLYAIRPTGLEPDGTYQWEWTGKGADRKFSTPANWYANAKPPEKQINAFGAADAYTEPLFDKVYNGDVAGTTLGQLLFLPTAVKSFAIGGSSTITLGNNAAPTDYKTTTVSVMSQTRMEQSIDRPLRSTNHLSVFAKEDGPVTLNGGFAMATKSQSLYGYGDVRVGGGVTTKWPNLQLYAGGTKPMGTSFTVLSGTSMTFTNQNANFGAASASLRVCESATLVFDGVSSSYFYRWTNKPSPHIVDGRMDVNVEFRSGADQTFAGKGTLNLSTLRPFGTVSSAVRFADTLTVNLSSASWPTVSGESGATMLTMQAAGHPVVHVPSGWTYGPAAGADTALSSAAARALVLQAQGVLTLEAAGGTATLDDPIAGRGTLLITNGTLRVNAASDAEFAGFATAPGASLEINAAQTLGAITLAEGTAATINEDVTLGALSAAGATLNLASGVKIAAPDGLDVTGIAFNLAEPTADTPRWQTLVTSAGAITGEPSLPKLWRYRVRAADGVNILEAGPERGLILILR